MDRSAFEQRIAKSAVVAERVEFTLPVSGDEIHLRRPNREQVSRCVAAAGDEDDQGFLVMLNLLRFALIDEEGRQLPRSYKEAHAWWYSLDDDDAAEVLLRLGPLVDETAEVDVDAPKGS